MKILRFNNFLIKEQGSGDMPACSCRKKKKMKSGVKKMKWSSKMMSERFEIVYERCGVCGGMRKRKKARKPIKLHID